MTKDIVKDLTRAMLLDQPFMEGWDELTWRQRQWLVQGAVDIEAWRWLKTVLLVDATMTKHVPLSLACGLFETCTQEELLTIVDQEHASQLWYFWLDTALYIGREDIGTFLWTFLWTYPAFALCQQQWMNEENWDEVDECSYLPREAIRGKCFSLASIILQDTLLFYEEHHAREKINVVCEDCFDIMEHMLKKEDIHQNDIHHLLLILDKANTNVLAYDAHPTVCVSMRTALEKQSILDVVSHPLLNPTRKM